MHSWLRIIALAALTCAASTAVCGPTPMADVVSMETNSNVIVHGRIVHVQMVAPFRESVQVEVIRVLRGSAKMVGGPLDFSVDVEATNLPVAEHGYGIFFLRCAGPKACRAAMPGSPALEAPGTAWQPANAGATIQDQMRQMLRQMALSSGAELERDLPAFYTGSPGRARIQAEAVRSRSVNALGTLPPGTDVKTIAGRDAIERSRHPAGRGRAAGPGRRLLASARGGRAGHR